MGNFLILGVAIKMALTLREQINLARDPRFLDQVQQALILVAGLVSSETVATANHTNRANLAYQVKNDPEQFVQRFSYGVTADPTVLGYDPTSTGDALVIAAITAEWDAMAKDNTFHDRVLNTFIAMAITILSTMPATGATPDQVKQATIANKFLNGQEGFLGSILQPMAIQFKIRQPTDTELQTSAQQLFLAYSAAPVTV